MTEWGVGVTQRDNWDVHVRCFQDRLVVSAWVGHHQQTGLTERCLDLIGEGTGGEASRDRGGTGVGGKLQDGTLVE